MERIEIHPIKQDFYRNLGKLKGWQITRIGKGQAVKAHSHKFHAVYFTNGVKKLYSKVKTMELPEFASVFVPKGVEHAWSGVLEKMEKAEIGHFHEGHGIHAIVPEY